MSNWFHPYQNAAVAAAEGPARTCLFCNSESHPSCRCESSQTTQQRWEVLRDKRRWFRCFRSDHSRARCNHPSVRCEGCGSKGHYEPLCRDAAERRPEGTVAANSEVSGVGHRTLLHTAQAFVLHGGQEVPVRVFFDSGSSLSFISKQIISALPGLRPRQDAILSLRGFGAEPVSRTPYDSSKVPSRTTGGTTAYRCRARRPS